MQLQMMQRASAPRPLAARKVPFRCAQPRARRMPSVQPRAHFGSWFGIGKSKQDLEIEALQKELNKKKKLKAQNDHFRNVVIAFCITLFILCWRIKVYLDL